MPKKKWDIGDSAEPEAPSFSDYDGPLPPKGVYAGRLKLLRLKQNKNSDDMINGLIELKNPGDKKKYDGCPVWFNQNITEQGLPYVKQFLDGLGVTWKDFLNKTVVDDEEPPNITKIGSVKITGENKMRISTKIRTYEGEKQVAVASFLAPASASDKDADDDDDDSGDDDDDEPPF